MPRFVYKSFVLDSRYIFEIDREVILFTQQRGKLKTIGRGGAKIPNRFGSAISPFSLVEATVWESWKGGLTLETTELIIPGFLFITNPYLYPYLSSLQEVLLILLPENLPREKVFRLLEKSIKYIRENPVALSFYILYWALKLEGFPVDKKISRTLLEKLKLPPSEFSKIRISSPLFVSLLGKVEYFLSRKLNSLVYLKSFLNIL